PAFLARGCGQPKSEDSPGACRAGGAVFALPDRSVLVAGGGALPDARSRLNDYLLAALRKGRTVRTCAISPRPMANTWSSGPGAIVPTPVNDPNAGMTKRRGPCRAQKHGARCDLPGPNIITPGCTCPQTAGRPPVSQSG